MRIIVCGEGVEEKIEGRENEVVGMGGVSVEGEVGYVERC